VAPIYGSVIPDIKKEGYFAAVAGTDPYST
jgi:hypothetical protein